MSDVGESEFLPALMYAVRRDAPRVRIETRQTTPSCAITPRTCGYLGIGLRWSHRADDDPGNRWLRDVVTRLFREGARAIARR